MRVRVRGEGGLGFIDVVVESSGFDYPFFPIILATTTVKHFFSICCHLSASHVAG